MNTLNRRLAALAGALVAVGGLAACSSSSSPGGGSSTPAAPTTGQATSPAATTAGSSAPAALTKVSLQLQWYTQAQFAGYIAALKLGYYKDAGIDLTIMQGSADIVPQNVLAQGKADFAIAWVPKALQSREQGAAITDVGQVFQRSGTLQVSMKDKTITSPADLKGKVVGDWGYGNEYELFAGMDKAGLDPGKDVKIVQQQFDMNGLLSGDIDAAQGMIYNEYAQVLEAKNPKTGKLYTPADLNTINWNTVGTAMLQDAVWTSTKKLADPAWQATTVTFLEASYKGWIYCSTHAQECRDIVVQAGSKLGASHQLWQMNEINKLIWPSPKGIGMVDPAAWNRTIAVAEHTKNIDGDTVLKAAPTGLAYTNDYTEKALADLKSGGADVTGASFKPITVTLNPGGS